MRQPLTERIVFLDYLRVIACFMVIIVHVCEFYYCGATGISVSDADRPWVAWIDGAFRQSVPLFVMASSFLLAPIPTDSTTFFKRRFSRIIVPFLFWSIFYATIPVWLGRTGGTVSEHLSRLLYNLNLDSGHLWFIYMLAGVYLVLPVISPWLRQVSARGERIFLGIWFITTFAPYLRHPLGDIWGQVTWNDFHALYYYSGFIGYVVLAHYIREHVRWSLKKSVAVAAPLIIIGYIVTAGLFHIHSFTSTDYAYVEQSWTFCTFNVAMMTTGTFLLMRHINISTPRIYKPVKTISRLSYGIYLMHIFVLGYIFEWLSPHLTTPVSIAVVGTVTFIACTLICRLLSLIPGSRWIIG